MEGNSGDIVVPAEVAGYDWNGVYLRIHSFFAHRRRADADDLTQETMMRAIKWLSSKEHSIEGTDGFVKFLHGCARNVLLEQYRKDGERAQRELPMEEATEKGHAARQAGADRLLAMREALSRLSAEERDCLYRSQLEAAQEVAKDLGIPLQTLRVRVFRARRRLRELLEGSGERDANGNIIQHRAIHRLERDLADE